MSLAVCTGPRRISRYKLLGMSSEVTYHSTCEGKQQTRALELAGCQSVSLL